MTAKRLCALAFALMLATGAAAQGTSVAFGDLRQNTDAPVEMSADELRVDQSSGVAIFTGNVVIGQGPMRLSAETVRVVYNAGNTGVARLEARGGVTLVSGPDAAEAETADYDVEGGEIVMTGDVLLTQGPNAITAERMTIDLAAGTARMSGRVRTVLLPSGN